MAKRSSICDLNHNFRQGVSTEKNVKKKRKKEMFSALEMHMQQCVMCPRMSNEKSFTCLTLMIMMMMIQLGLRIWTETHCAN